MNGSYEGFLLLCTKAYHHDLVEEILLENHGDKSKEERIAQGEFLIVISHCLKDYSTFGGWNLQFIIALVVGDGIYLRIVFKVNGDTGKRQIIVRSDDGSLKDGLGVCFGGIHQGSEENAAQNE